MARTFLQQHLILEGQRQTKKETKGRPSLLLQNHPHNRGINHPLPAPYGTTFFYQPLPPISFAIEISTLALIQEPHSNCGKGHELCQGDTKVLEQLEDTLSHHRQPGESCLLKKMGIIIPGQSMDCVLFLVGLIQNIETPVHINNLFIYLFYYLIFIQVYVIC